MKVVVAMDSFKGSLSAHQASAAVQRGLEREIPGVRVVCSPMADGGDGTAAVLRNALDGQWIEEETAGPLPMQRVQAGYLWMPRQGPGALVEMASASGLSLLGPGQLDPLRTTTVGTGQLLERAARKGARKLWLTLGGSATVDGGVGAATALGWRFRDHQGLLVEPGGGHLENIVTLVPPQRATLPECEVLCDVDNPLVGERGAARIFGPQKGATPEQVKQLETGLENLALRWSDQLGLDLSETPGGGAAGGFGAGAIAFFGADLKQGGRAVSELTGLAEKLVDASWVITGEGRLDRQSLDGKVVSAVLEKALVQGVDVAVIAGQVALSPEEALASGLRAAEAAMPTDLSLGQALEQAESLLEGAARRFARSFLESDSNGS